MENNKTVKLGFGLVFISLFGKVCGLIKQIVIAWAFGASDATDVYFVADGAVAMIAVVISGALSVTLLSCYSKKLNESIERKRLFVGNVMTWGAIASTFIVVMLSIFSPILSEVLAPEFDRNQHDQLTKYIVLLSFSIIFILSSSLGGAFLEGECDFTPSKLQNVFISLSTIVVVAVLYKQIGMYGLLLGYIAGYFFHYLFVVLRLKRKKLLIYSWPKLDADILRIMKMSILIAIGNSAVEINHLIDKMIASGLEKGSVSALYYGQIVSTDIVTTTLVYSISAIFVRDFSKRASEGDVEGIKIRVKTVCGIFAPLGGLLIALYYFYSNDIIKLLLMRGNFDQEAADITRIVVLGYMFCFVLVPIKDILMKTHYAMLDSKRPMIICIIESMMNIAISFALSRYIGILGIALGTSVSTLISSVIFRLSVTKYLSEFKIFSLRQIFIIILSGIAICGIKRTLDYTVISKFMIGRFGIAIFLCLVYVALLLLFKYPYIKSAMSRIHK